MKTTRIVQNPISQIEKRCNVDALGGIKAGLFLPEIIHADTPESGAEKLPKFSQELSKAVLDVVMGTTNHDRKAWTWTYLGGIVAEAKYGFRDPEYGMKLVIQILEQPLAISDLSVAAELNRWQQKRREGK